MSPPTGARPEMAVFPASRQKNSLPLLTPLLLATALQPAMAAGVEEIVVSARKRDERLQDVPISVAALSAERLQAFGLRSDEDVAAFTPNFNTVRRVGRSEVAP